MNFLKAILAASALCAAASAARAQSYPDRPIRMIVPLAAASAVDNAARIVTQKMAENMGQPIAVLNNSGAAGVIGAGEVARAAPDGYTLGGFNDSIMTMLPNMQADLKWDILRDFEPVSLVATVEWGMIASNKTPWKTAGDFIADAKSRPGKIDFASGGNGSPQHIAMALFAQNAGISLTHVSYRGATQAAADVASGQVPVGMQGLATVAGLVRGDQMKLLGVSTSAPLAQFPGVPTISQSGLPDFTFNSWFTIMAPAGTPKEIVARLNAEVVKALADPGVREKLINQGLTPRGSPPEELRAATKAQLEKYARLIKAAGITNE